MYTYIRTEWVYNWKLVCHDCSVGFKEPSDLTTTSFIQSLIIHSTIFHSFVSIHFTFYCPIAQWWVGIVKAAHFMLSQCFETFYDFLFLMKYLMFYLLAPRSPPCLRLAVWLSVCLPALVTANFPTTTDTTLSTHSNDDFISVISIARLFKA